MQEAIAILRIALGLIFLRHGYPKLKNPMWGTHLGLPKIASIYGMIAEFFGGLALLIGAYTQIASILLIIMMIGALYFHIIKWKHQFYNPEGKSWEYPFFLLIALIVIYLAGPGTYALLN